MNSRILLDLQACATEGSRGRGIGRYSQHLAENLIALRRDQHFTVALNGLYENATEDLAARFDAAVGETNVCVYSYPKPAGKWNPHTLDYSRAAAEALITNAWLSRRPDILHIGSVFEGQDGLAVVPSLRGLPRNTVVSATAYDLIPLLFKEIYLSDLQVRRYYESRLDRLRNCDVLLAISEATRGDLIGALGIEPARVVNISAAVDAIFVPLAVAPDRQAAIRRQFGIHKPVVMYTGGIDHRKNVEGLIRAFAKLAPDLRNSHQLAIVCRIQNADRDYLMSLARTCGLAPDSLVLTGFVGDEDLVDLYRSCRLFVFPSLYEGFGLPVLEAMSCGAPTIAANTSSLPEIVGRRDALFSIVNEENIAAALTNALRDEGFRRDLAVSGLERAKKFSWKASAEQALAALEEARARKASHIFSAGPPKPRLALVSPLLPEKSGIAGYVTELLPHLAQHFEIDLFVTEYVDCERYRAMGFATHGWQTLPGCWQDYDAGVLYQFGNSHFHAHMLPLLRSCPGTVMLHDVYLSGLMGFLEFAGRVPADFLYDMLEFCHGSDAVAYARQEGADRAIIRYPLARWVTENENATGVIVTSEHARFLLQTYQLLDRTPSTVVPLHGTARKISAEQRASARSALQIADDVFLACSFGYAAVTKHCMPLVTAWKARSLNSGKALLVFVGDDSSYGDELRKHIAECGLQQEVVITGFVGEEEFGQYLCAADLAIQLRTFSRGEASATALQALSYGIPLIASRHGSLAEIPDSVCAHVSDPVDTSEIARTIDELQRDPSRRLSLGKRGQAWVEDAVNPERVSKQMASSILRFNDPVIAGNKYNLKSRLARVGATISDRERRSWFEGVRSTYPRSVDELGLDRIGSRIDGIVSALYPGAEIRISPAHPRLPRGLALSATDAGVHSTCGIKIAEKVQSNGKSGFVFCGPPMAIAEGKYRLRLFGTWREGTASHNAVLDVVGRSGADVYSRAELASDSSIDGIPGLLARVDLGIPCLMTDLQVRLRVEEGVLIEIEHCELVPR